MWYPKKDAGRSKNILYFENKCYCGLEQCKRGPILTLVIFEACSSLGLIALLGRNAKVHNLLNDQIVAITSNSDFFFKVRVVDQFCTHFILGMSVV